MSNRLENLVDRIRQGLGFRTDVDDLIKRCIDEEIRYLQMGKTSPLGMQWETDETLLTDSNIVAFTNDEDVTVLNVMRPQKTYLWYAPVSDPSTPRTPIAWITDKSEFQTTVEDNIRGAPKYAFWDRSLKWLWFIPRADQDYTIYFNFDLQEDMISLDSPEGEAAPTEIDWVRFYPNAVMAGAGRRAAAILRDKEAAAEFDRMSQQEQVAMFKERVLNDQLSQPLTLGSDN